MSKGEKAGHQSVGSHLSPVLTPGCLGSELLTLTGMELWPFREDVGDLLPLVVMDVLLGEEVGVVAV